MGNIRPACKVKLITALISNDAGLFEKAKRLLEKKFKNRVDFESKTLDFTYTDYYSGELGQGLKRKFFSFERAVGLKDIEKTKLASNELEKRLSVNGRRLVNIDPGYLDLAKVVLFSTKDYSHRIHVGGNIFAEVTLHFKNESFNAWPWTYPDYRTSDYISIFNSIRGRFKNEGHRRK